MRNENSMAFSSSMIKSLLKDLKSQTRRPLEDLDGYICCTYGNAGDRLWVKEEHYRYGYWQRNGLTKHGRHKWKFVAVSNSIIYSEEPPPNAQAKRYKQSPGAPMWYRRHSRFMKKSQARIWLEIKETKLERVCEISFEDAVAEGVDKIGDRFRLYGKYSPGFTYDPIRSFLTLWSELYGQDAIHQTVWAITFDVLSKTGKPKKKYKLLN